ncbi:MAG: hypothetical protein AAFO72_06035 [Pseudomonadota bacterium]
MSLKVTSGEHGVVRVFSLGYRVSMELQHFEAVDKLAQALGIDQLKPEDVQIVDLSAVSDMGLSGFLTEAYGVAEEQMVPLAESLNALQGHVAVLRSGAFDGAALTLPVSDDVRLVATLHEPRMSAPAPMPNFQSARGTANGPKERKPLSDKAMSGRIAMYALLAVFAFTIMFVWIAS